MAFLIFTDKAKAEAAQLKRDVELGYPESLENLRHVGGGRHAPKTLGRAIHYCRLVEHKDGGQWAIVDTDKVAQEPDATKISELPVEWFPDDPLESLPKSMQPKEMSVGDEQITLKNKKALKGSKLKKMKQKLFQIFEKRKEIEDADIQK